MSIEFDPVDPAITLDSLTQATTSGDGVFDTLMRAFKAHLDEQYNKNRIRGAEYAQVYLAGVQQVLQTSLAFTLNQEEQNLKNELARQQIALAKLQQDQVRSQTALTDQQKANLVDELQTAAKQRQKLDQDILNEQAQLTLIQAQVAQSGSQKALLDQQKANLVDELQTTAKNRQNLDAQISLYNQKVVTERAQVDGTNVADRSVLGRQMGLYQRQADGFKRDAEQKAASVLVDTWKVRRTTDEGTVADTTNRLDDGTIGTVIARLIQGLDA